MTADQLIDKFSQLGPQEQHVLFHFLADHLTEARLLNGQRLCDPTDFKAWLRELGDVALSARRQRAARPVEQRRW